MNFALIFSLFSTLLFGLLAAYFSFSEEKTKKILKEQTGQQKQKIYQIEILKEIQDKIGYSLDIEKIIDVITGSLRNLFSYSTASSIVVKEDKLIFKTYIEEGVNKTFVSAVKASMLASLTSLLGSLPSHIEEALSGVPLNNSNVSLASFFHIPLIVSNRVVGLINVSSTKPNLYQEEEMTILYQITGQASNALTKLQAVLKSEEQKREDLTNMLVHELRAPLTAIKYSSELLNTSSNLKEGQQKKFLNLIHEQAKVLLAQIEDILDAAKLEAGKFIIQKTPRNDLLSLLQERLTAFSPQAAEKQISLILQSSSNVPLIALDAARIAQVINNLLSNSLKFTPHGGVIKITVKYEPATPNQLTVAVADTGIGIPYEKQKDLFSKYSKISILKGSTGLGLYVVKGIVEAHGGTVSAFSTEGKGTAVSFTLPVDQETITQIPSQEPFSVPRQTIN